MVSIVETISTTITHEYAKKAREHNIKWSEALRVGIGVILAEQGEENYIGGINVYRKLNALRERLEETTQALNELKGVDYAMEQKQKKN